MRPIVEAIPKGTFPARDDTYSSIISSFMECNEEIFSANYDIKFSGSTCVTVMIYGNKVITANVGDSRAILVSHGQEGKLQVTLGLYCK
jgi:serine/threonine protein phosphatase PrpC